MVIIMDTDTCIELLRGNGAVIERRGASLDEVRITWINAAELFYGAEKSRQPEQNRAKVERFLLTVGLLLPDLPILRRFGSIKTVLSRQGLIIPDADLFIAATALTRAATLVTGNTRHFRRIYGLVLDNWIRP